MASAKTLNAKNLTALGAERLAELIMELSQGDAAMKRRLRLELAGQSGGGDAAAEIRKRLATIAKSKSFVDWHKVKALAKDFDAQRCAILKHVAATQPTEAYDLLWRLLELAPSVYERCDDSNGTIGNVFALALENLGEIAPQARVDKARLADRVFDAIDDNGYGQFDNLIPVMATALEADGLRLLKSKLERLLKAESTATGQGDRKVIAISTRGPIHEDYTAKYRGRRVQSALAEIADALDDADGFAAVYSEEERSNPAIAAKIAERLLEAGRSAEALEALVRANAVLNDGGYWPDWERVWIDALEAAGRPDEAQQERWQAFERSLTPEYLKAYIKRLPDFDDMEAEDKALTYAARYPEFYQGLSFLIQWGALDQASEMILTRHRELKEDHYWFLNQAADALEQRHPLAATLVLRSMIDFALKTARSKRYVHAARHLKTCAHLAGKISSFGEHPDHESYLADLKVHHGRKAAFWNA